MKSVTVYVMDNSALFQISSMTNATHEKVAAAVRDANFAEVTDNRPNYAFRVAAQNLDGAETALNAINALITVSEINAENKKGDRKQFPQLIDAARFALAR